MGKRQRRREREEAGPITAQPQREHQLGAPGPYMVCGLCNDPVNLITYVSHDTGQETEIGYTHNLEVIDNHGKIVKSGKDYGHEALPVEGNPLDAGGGCDFCYAPEPRWVFVPRRPIVVTDISGNEDDYSSPWSCCDSCLPVVKSKNLTRMVDNAMKSQYSTVLANLTPELRPIYRKAIGKLYSIYLKSAPAGPYELRIPGPHKPVGKRGSLRGQ